MNELEYLARLLGVSTESLLELETLNAQATRKTGVLSQIARELREKSEQVCAHLQIKDHQAASFREALREAVFAHEKEILSIVQSAEGKDQFEKAATLARSIAKVDKGFFLKKKYGEEILTKRPPEQLLKFLGYKNVTELFAKHDVTEVFSALRFMETNEWMHETFEIAYSHFTADAFEEREIEIKVLGPEWQPVAEKFVAKKHHNVSHLKEFGVIFLNPIGENTPGKFIRDFALLLHYFHEIEFYSKLFRRYAHEFDFATRFKALLRGDVREAEVARPGEWLIVQRYLFKEDPNDPRLILPRVNPESRHWRKGELDLARFGKEKGLGVAFWGDLDWAATLSEDDGRLVSFDLEDNAMSAVTYAERRAEFYSYHQREALWTKIFREYVGGEEELEEWLLKTFNQGVVQLG